MRTNKFKEDRQKEKNQAETKKIVTISNKRRKNNKTKYEIQLKNKEFLKKTCFSSDTNSNLKTKHRQIDEKRQIQKPTLNFNLNSKFEKEDKVNLREISKIIKETERFPCVFNQKISLKKLVFYYNKYWNNELDSDSDYINSESESI